MTAVTRQGSLAGAATRVHAASELHPVAWAAWLCSGLAMVLITSNPLYITLIALAAAVVYVSQRRRGRRAIDLLLAGGVVFALVTIPLNLVTGSSGATTNGRDTLAGSCAMSGLTTLTIDASFWCATMRSEVGTKLTWIWYVTAGRKKGS